jgi:hypothetical protein
MGGSGLVQPFGASRTSAVAVDEEGGAANLSFGVQEFGSDFSRTKTIRVTNFGEDALRFAVSAVAAAGSPSTVEVEPQVLWVSAGSSREVSVTLRVPVAKVGDSSDFRDVSGLIKLTPSKGWNGDATLTVPYYLVPRARSKVRTRLPGDFGPAKPAATAKVKNEGNVPGTADFYAWGLSGTNTKAGDVGLRAVGVQANPLGGDQLLFFAINTFKRWSNNSGNEFDVLIDTKGDGKPHFAVIATDLGYLTTGTPVGQMVTAVLNIDDPASSPGIQFPVTAPTDGTTMLVPVFAGDIGVTAKAPRFAYSVQSFSTTGATDVASGWAKFNAFHNAVSTAAYVPLDPGAHASVPLAIDPAEWAQTPALGVMVVGLENFNGGQARLLGIGRPGDTD